MEIEVNKSIQEIEDMPDSPEKAAEWLVYGLTWDEAHHKTWFVEQALKALGVDLDVLADNLREQDSGWEPGISP